MSEPKAEKIEVRPGLQIPISAVVMAAVHLYKQVPEDERMNPYFAAEARRFAAREAVMLSAAVGDASWEWEEKSACEKLHLLYPEKNFKKASAPPQEKTP